MMRSRFRNVAAALAIPVLGLALSGVPAKAALVLTLTDKSGATTNESIVITNGTAAGTNNGSFIVSAPTGTPTVYINGTMYANVTPGTTYHFNTLDPASVTFAAFSFGNLADYGVTATEINSPIHSSIEVATNPMTAGIKQASGTSNDTLTIGTSYDGFTTSNATDRLSSSFVSSSSAGTPTITGSTSFSSTLGSTSTATLMSTNPSNTLPAPNSVSVYPVSPTYTASNNITISGLSSQDSVKFDVKTDIVATPEPSTIVLAMASLPVLGLIACRPKRNAPKA